MINKTQGIVLNRQKFTDNKIIVSVFTRLSGKKSFIVFNSNSKKNKTINLFQPLFVLDLEFLNKQNTNLLNIKEVSIYKPFSYITSSPEKMAIVFFISEILTKTIEDELVDESLFDFLLNSVFILDQSQKPANFHIAFLAAYSIYIGIMPENNYRSNNKFFDIREGKFSANFSKNYSMDENLSRKFFQILNEGITGFQNVKLNRNERNALVANIINFFAYNFNSVNNLKSLDVLTEIFKD